MAACAASHTCAISAALPELKRLVGSEIANEATTRPADPKIGAPMQQTPGANYSRSRL